MRVLLRAVPLTCRQADGQTDLPPSALAVVYSRFARAGEVQVLASGA
jgi:hypothetical protein